MLDIRKRLNVTDMIDEKGDCVSKLAEPLGNNGNTRDKSLPYKLICWYC